MNSDFWRQQNIILYGAGKDFDLYFVKLSQVREYLNAEGIRIAGIIDAKLSPGDTVQIPGTSIPVVSREEAVNLAFDYLVITSSKYVDEIRREALEWCDGKKIVSLQDFLVPLEKTLYHTEIFKYLQGVEIGGPSNSFRTIYPELSSCDGVNFSADTVWWKKGNKDYFYKDRRLGKVIIADAADLSQIADASYDAVLSSNNLEHLANPLKALKEFDRILKMGGLLVLFLPRKEFCFDHRREDTTFEHLLKDFQNNVREDDISDLDEVIKDYDFDMDPGVKSREDYIERAQDNFHNRCMHHHVFSMSLLEQCMDFLGYDVLYETEYTNHCIIARKH